MESNEIETALSEYEAHLSKTAEVFNTWSEQSGLPIIMDTQKAIDAVKMGVGLAEVAHYWAMHDEFGVVHETQTKTAVECIVKLWKDPKQCGHVVGAMQSGKTTTSLALQWTGPILYLLTGRRVHPFYIIGSQTGHEDQTTTELERFFTYYGNIEFKMTANAVGYADVAAMFGRSPSLTTYRRNVLAGMLKDVLDVPRLEELIHRRVGGEQSLSKIVDLSQRATEKGYSPLMIIDEPQFGASDPVAETSADGQVERKCVLAQIFDRIEQALGSTSGDHWFVGLSATPFELNDLARVWEVRQYLTPDYSGFNYFNGKPISEGVDIKPPTTMSLSAFAASINVPSLANVVMSAYDKNKPSAFLQHARKIRYKKSQAEYRQETEDALRKTVYALLDSYKDESDEPAGLCIRALNDNAKTSALISALALDPKRVEVIEYYGADMTRTSVKRAVAHRQYPTLPYIIFVTNRARMADAFPTQVRFFMDFGIKASDLNSLLQGLLGRACGYNKKSTVVLSDASAAIVDAYVATKGKYVHRTSRHSVAVGGYRRGAPTGMLKLHADQNDTVVKEYFRLVNKEVVEPNIPDSTTLKTRRGRGGFRKGPVLLIAERLGLFDHIEEPAVRAAIFANIPGGFQVARRADTVYHSRERDVPLNYSVDEDGNCRYTFRWQREAQGGAAGRAKGQRDTGQHMEPTIYVEKYDSTTGDVIDDKNMPEAEQKMGRWRAFMVTFPLVDPVREIRPATIALPIARSPYSKLMTVEEKMLRDGQVIEPITPAKQE